MTATTTLDALSPAATLAPATRTRRRRGWRLLFAGVGLAGLLLLTALVLSFRLGGEARALRRAVFAAAPDQWERRFECGLGRLPVFLAQAGLAFAPLDPGVQAALGALDCADVGIYQRRPGTPRPDDRQATFLAVQQVMERKGWEPLVLVQDGADTVGVFVPQLPPSRRHLTACVMVMNRNDLVLVPARANPEPLLALALEAIEKSAPRHLPEL